MKTQYGYLHYWWFDSGYGPSIKCRHAKRKHSASRMQAEHKENGWPVSRMKVVRVKLPPKKRGMK